MKRLLPLAVMTALAFPLVSCFQHTYIIGAGAPEDGNIVYKNWHHHWLFGLIRPERQEELGLDELCPSGNARIHEEVSFVNGLIDVLIGIIYSPTTVTVTCDDGSTAQLELEEEDIAAILAHPVFLQKVEDLVPERLASVQQILLEPSETTSAQPSAAR